MTKTISNDTLKLIFRKLNLNERSNVRLASKRFKKLCDSIKIRTLIIFENGIGSAGKLVYTGREYDEVDTVSVGDLQKLFNNRTIMRQMRPIQTLVIHACYLNYETNEYELRSRFSKLKHLELYNINITSSDIVECSEKIECLKLHNVILKSREFFDRTMKEYADEINNYLANRDRVLFINDRANSSPSFLFLGLEAVRSADLKYFSTNFAFDMPKFLVDCINSGIFESLEQIDLVAYDLDNLGLLIERSPNLKVINLKFYMLNKLFKQVGTGKDVVRIMSQFRDDLSVYLYGLLWNQQTAGRLFKFLGDLMEIDLPGNREVLGVDGEGDLDLIVSASVYEYLAGLDEQLAVLARRFFEEIGCVQTSAHLIERDEEFFRQFRNCVKINLDVDSSSIECLSTFPKLVTMRLEFRMADYSDEILYPIEESCGLVQHLTVVICNKINNFDFLFELKRLKSINLLLYYPIGQAVVVQLIRELKYLRMMSVCFVKPAGFLDEEELRAFRKSVNDTFSKKFKARGLQFLVQVYSKKSKQVLRYIVDKAASIEANKLLDCEMDRMFRFAEQHRDEN